MSPEAIFQHTIAATVVRTERVPGLVIVIMLTVQLLTIVARVAGLTV